ncbi:MAG: hypothetical protein ACM30E_07020 [Nitrososphaerales archaeon]
MTAMYQRQPQDWDRDLDDRRFEEQVKAALDRMRWRYQDFTSSHDLPDLVLLHTVGDERVNVALELKEKRQRYRPRWEELARLPESDVLALDEVAARKLLPFAPYAFLLYHDATGRGRPYVLYSILDLMCAPKVRVQRPINLHSERLKGKWLLNRRHGRPFSGLNDTLLELRAYVNNELPNDLRGLGAHGRYDGEVVETL